MPPEKDDAEVRIQALVSPDEIEDLPQTPFWSTMWRFLSRHRGGLLIGAVCSMFVGVAVALQPIVPKYIIDSGILRETAEGVYAPAEVRLRYALAFVGLFIFLSFFRMAVWLFGRRYMVRAVEGFLCHLRNRFFRHVQGLCFRFHDEVSSGELFNYIMGSPVNSLKMFLHQFSMAVPYQVVSWFVAIGFLLSFNWMMALITVVVVVAVVIINSRSRLRMREVSADFMQTESEASRYVADMLQGSRAVKIYTMEDDIESSFARQTDAIREKGIRVAIQQQIESMKPEGVQYIGEAVIFVAGAWFCIYRNMQVGTFTAFIASFNRLMQPLMMMAQLNLMRANAEAGLDRIMRILHVAKTTPEPAVESAVPVEQAERNAREAGLPCIAFEGVRFRYNDRTPVFEDLTCSIEDGQSVALVGPSGSGKTTFVSLLLRLYDPQAGRILLNGEPLSSYTLQGLRSCFGVVPQDPFLFQTTVRNNICVTRPDADEEEVRRAMAIAYMDEFVEELPDGLETWIGEKGFNLSGGQRQRLAIARAVLADPRYFVFDEATSALDTVSERRVQQAMEELMPGHTTVVIAHRLSTIRNVDRIFVFEEGRVVQDGSYDALAARPGLFQTLVTRAEGGSIGG
jgi:ABC-type multidrug transport system fused ATPase/permease subunit